ncbi:carbohydrate ABC transporter permease [Alicyclobacillus sp. SO9]|uniref:carbohydrate ABC transporter permease n=1 Tax=Alicyclobacillus sp. SO9 TaxID=2665646 RepID=UPI001E374D33|nr:carbohydrate ABC transporter permease [Alicyclobacillus sp. SO9]
MKRYKDSIYWILLSTVALIWGFPTVWVVFETFFGGNHHFGFTFKNLIDAWKAAPFPQYSVNTVIIVLGLLLIQLVFGAVAGFILARYEFPFKSLVTLVFIMQIVVPVYAVLIQEYDILRGFHLLDTKLGIMLPYAVSGIAVLSFRQAFKSVPPELEEAARMDGYNTLGIFRRVYLPQAIPASLAFGVISLTYHWTDFLWPMIVTNTAHARPIVVGLAMIAQSSESGMQWNLLASATAIVIIPVLIVFSLATRKILSAFSSTFNW